MMNIGVPGIKYLKPENVALFYKQVTNASLHCRSSGWHHQQAC